MAFAQVLTHLAVATPFLILPTCRSLHVMESGHGPQELVVFGTHHKTGTELALEASKCFGSSFRHTVDTHWKGDKLHPHEKLVHFARNPTSLALSAYIYHKETGEDWSLKPGGEMDRLVEDPFLRKFWINSSESYTEFLRRVDTRVGIRAEINRLTHESAELNEMENAAEFCSARDRCMQLCLEDFTSSSSSYDASWRKVFKFVGGRLTPQMHQCLSKLDLNRRTVVDHENHVTATLVPEWQFNQLIKIVVEVDAENFNSRLKKLGTGELYCGGYSSSFLHTETGSNATDGGAYKEWIVAETIS